MNDIAILNIGTAVFTVGLFAEVMFLLDYGLTAPWYRSWIGWMFVLNGIAVMSAGASIMVGRLLGSEYPGRPIITLVTFGAFTLSTVMRYGVFQWERRKPSSRLPMPYFDQSFDPPLSRLTRQERRRMRGAARQALRHRK